MMAIGDRDGSREDASEMGCNNAPALLKIQGLISFKLQWNLGKSQSKHLEFKAMGDGLHEGEFEAL